LCSGKVLIFEDKKDGVWLGDALPQEASIVSEQVDKKSQDLIERNEVEQIATFLKGKGFHIHIEPLTEKYYQGLTLSKTKNIYQEHHKRYEQYLYRPHIDKISIGIAMFNAFIFDCDRIQQVNDITPYATFNGE
jgi:hypothetical protein